MNKCIQIMLFIFLSSYCTSTYAQSTWATLSMVTFEKKYDENMGFEVEVPTVNPIVKALDGKEIEVDGYIIPLEGKVKQSHFMLSSLPVNMCFFCGKAGPETAMQVFMDQSKTVSFSDEKIKVKGILRINESDSNGLLYTLENAILL